MPTHHSSEFHQNYILATLPQAEYDAIAPHLSIVEPTSGALLYMPNERIDAVYFPLTSLISLVGLAEDGSETEVGLIGSEGLLGIHVFLGRVIN